MRYQTHILTSVAGTLALNAYTEMPISAAIIGGVVIGALLPDIDEPQSFIGKKTRGVSDVTKGVFGHRGFTHTILGSALFAGLLYLLYMLFGYIDIKMENSMEEKILISALFSAIMTIMIYLIGDVLYKFGITIKFIKYLKKYLYVFPILFVATLLIENQTLFDFSKEVYIGLTLGYVLHIVGDFFSKSGVPLFLPLTNLKVKIYLYRTGGKREQIIKILAIAAIVYFLYIMF